RPISWPRPFAGPSNRPPRRTATGWAVPPRRRFRYSNGSPTITGPRPTEVTTVSTPPSELARPHGRYGVDGDYRLIPAPVVFGGYLLVCLAAAVSAVVLLFAGRVLAAVVGGVVALALIGAGTSVLRYSRRGEYEVRARLLAALG